MAKEKKKLNILRTTEKILYPIMGIVFVFYTLYMLMGDFIILPYSDIVVIPIGILFIFPCIELYHAVLYKRTHPHRGIRPEVKIR